MKNQFFYRRKVQNTPVEGETEPTFKDVIDSFNINKVIRSYEISENQLLIALDDFHEETRQEPVTNSRGVVTSYKNAKNTYSSELILVDPEDIARFRTLTAIQ